MAFSDGSDGDLYIASGQTVALNLNRKYQYRNVTIEAGGTLTTNDTTGAVMYIAAQGAINVAGNILLNGKVNNGHNSWTITIDGITYNSPGVNLGGTGGGWTGGIRAPEGAGYGGGGAGGVVGSTWSNGGAGGASPGAGGGGGFADTGDTSNNTVYAAGAAGGTSAGGGGTAFAHARTTVGASRTRTQGYTGGGGGWAYGNHGGNGSWPSGTFWVTYEANDGSQIEFNYSSAGGGGAGGLAGKAGVHLTLRGSEVNVLATANINVSGSVGGAGGNGGVGYDYYGQQNAYGGLGGGGGGGGNGGTVWLYYGAAFKALGPVTRSGGTGGTGGVQGGSGIGTGQGGASGVGGSYFAGRSEAGYGSMIMMFN